MKGDLFGQRFVDCYGQCPPTVDDYEVAARIPADISRQEALKFWESIRPAWAGYHVEYGIGTWRTAAVAAALVARGWMARFVVTNSGVGVVMGTEKGVLRVLVDETEIVYVPESAVEDYHGRP